MRFAHEGILGERDACGTGFVASTTNTASHQVLQDALTAVSRLEHRGAVSADGVTSDGTGVLTEIPHTLLGIQPGTAVGVVFMGVNQESLGRSIVEDTLKVAQLEVSGWRAVPTKRDILGPSQRDIAPIIEQVFVAPNEDDELTFERRLMYARKRIETIAAERGVELSFASFSSKTIVYKALVLPSVLGAFYPDLTSDEYRTRVALFHQRYSTNTSPSWRLAQPFRMLAHNGEINTLLGNVNRMKARQNELVGDASETFADISLSAIETNPSDSLALDNILELLTLSGRNPVHAMGMLVPDAFESKDLEAGVRAFYRYHALVSQPWDGPAALAFTNGKTAAAALDRNGLRPLRYWHTKDRVIVGSEAGLVDVPEADIVEKGRLGPGQMLSVNLATGRVFRDEELKHELAGLGDWEDWLSEELPIPTADPEPVREGVELILDFKSFGYGREHLDKIIRPMAMTGNEPIGSMGDDTPLAALSEKPQRLSRFFKQRFAQVTNPPIDPIRERMVMSLTTRLGGRRSLLEVGGPAGPFVEFKSPILDRSQFAGLHTLGESFRVQTLDCTFPVEWGDEGLQRRLDELRDEALNASANGEVLVLSDKAVSESQAPVPILLALTSVHHHLIAHQARSGVALIMDSGDIVEDHDVACLLGFGALLVHPRCAISAAVDAVDDDVTPEQAEANYVKALEKGLLKILAKYGISTVGSYQGAQTFEALGLSDSVVESYFKGTPSRIGGATLPDLAHAVLAFHAEAYGENPRLKEKGIYRFRRDGEYHAFNPPVFKALHKAVRESDPAQYEEYARLVDDRPPTTLRDLVTWKRADEPVPLDEVESAESIVKRFCTQAMSFGSLSREAHETLAIAMNRIGGKSNSGEGGEEDVRFQPYDEDAPERSLAAWHPHKGDAGSSAIKQVASGRFGVTPYYLVSAEQLEIKMAQGSKPGEGGQIPGHKVTDDIAKTRRSVPGVTLISPPPHHDIYSIEDLAQLIHDLKRVNDRATVCVKLVAGTGVGTIAAGVTKGYADAIQISGHDGGTGASPLGSIKHAGLPWELGLSEVQRTLRANDLRGRVRLRVDGGLKTGRDVVIAALLGAEEFGFGTAPLVAAGCVMARQCHANTCPVGVATQREDLRARYPGKPDHVVSFMFFVAEHVRHILAQMGVRTMDELIGRTDLLERREGLPKRAQQLDLKCILEDSTQSDRQQTQPRNDRPDSNAVIDDVVQQVTSAIQEDTDFQSTFPISNRERSIGARISGTLARKHGNKVPETAVRLDFRGQAGQSFGAFNSESMELTLIGEAQDYVAKSMAGGRLVIRPASVGRQRPDVLVGNTVLYGATGGELLVDGLAGERLAVRNSGATGVFLGCGDHGCEYMTGGTIVILGRTGYNFAAGMSGGAAYVWDPDEEFPKRLNDEFVQIRRVDDDSELKPLIQHFRDATESFKADQILANWNPADFWLVEPKA